MSSSKTVFRENFMKFFQNNTISQNTDFEKGKHEWITIYNITEPTMHPCVCGHNVKHITYLFNEKNQNIVSVGTTCCKKYDLLGKHMKNELLIHILREEISEHCFKNSENLLTLEKDLGELLENYIYEKFQEIMKKYSRDMDENVFYFDVFYPLNRMKEDILELNDYGYDFSKHYDEIVEILREREIHIRETESIESDEETETNSEIMKKLDKIEDEISQLLNENFSDITDSENGDLDLEVNVMIDEEFITIELKEEEEKEKEKEEKENYIINEDRRIDREINLIIESEIQREEKEAEAEAYLENEEKEIEEAMTRYIERSIDNDFERKYTERDLRFMMDMHDLNMRIDNLKQGVELYKKEFIIFYANLQEFKKEVMEHNKKNR